MSGGLSGSHNHTTFCDGGNTPREMIEAALALGFSDIGFSAHKDPVIPLDEEAYLAALRALQAAYAGRIRVAVGLEQDREAPTARRADYDYIIGSVHYLPAADGALCAVDDQPARFAANLPRLGGAGAAVKAYYAAVADCAGRWRPQVIGHFDLICKNNAGGCLFDENASAYRRLALEALDACIDAGCIVELNTGGLFRGYRRRPYPALFLLRHLARRGGRVTINADAHETAALDYWFAPGRALLRRAGFDSLAVLRDGKFVDEPLESPQTS